MWGLPKSIFKPHEYWLSKTRCCNSAYRLRYWNGRIINQVYPSYRVATVLTVYGIETHLLLIHHPHYLLGRCNSAYRLRYWNLKFCNTVIAVLVAVATVLTVYGIETLCRGYIFSLILRCNSAYRLRYWNLSELSQLHASISFLLQQYLSFTVLKLYTVFTQCNFYL